MRPAPSPESACLREYARAFGAASTGPELHPPHADRLSRAGIGRRREPWVPEPENHLTGIEPADASTGLEDGNPCPECPSLPPAGTSPYPRLQREFGGESGKPDAPSLRPPAAADAPISQGIGNEGITATLAGSSALRGETLMCLQRTCMKDPCRPSRSSSVDRRPHPPTARRGVDARPGCRSSREGPACASGSPRPLLVRAPPRLSSRPDRPEEEHL